MTRGKTSQLSGFYKLSVEERLKHVQQFAELTDNEVELLRNIGALGRDRANRMIENVIGTIQLPIGIAVNFLINSREYIIPMAIEEPSVVAAASYAAKLARATGGFQTSSTAPVMIGQIQVTDLAKPVDAQKLISTHKTKLIEIANSVDPMLVKVGGGAKDIQVRVIETTVGTMLILHLLVDTRDAMGANAVNTMAEALAPYIESLTGGKVYLRILSNLAVYRLARAKVVYSPSVIGGDAVVDGIIRAYAFALADMFRCATHNKGIMNGIDAVAIATGNDFRAIEAGAHAYAAYREGTYKPLTRWEKTEDHKLIGTIELPLPVGIIGGATAVHPVAKVNLKILGVKSAVELGEIMAAVGLAQNFAALRALVTEGIQRGHMALHARNIALMAGVPDHLIDKVVDILVREKKVRLDRAREVLAELL
jgi:hydroxymethylglutaryl-CoA reductase